MAACVCLIPAWILSFSAAFPHGGERVLCGGVDLVRCLIMNIRQPECEEMGRGR